MKALAVIIGAILLLAACATGPSPKVEAEKEHRIYCKTHAREMFGEADEEGRYINCLNVKGRHEIVVEEID